MPVLVRSFLWLWIPGVLLGIAALLLLRRRLLARRSRAGEAPAPVVQFDDLALDRLAPLRAPRPGPAEKVAPPSSSSRRSCAATGEPAPVQRPGLDQRRVPGRAAAAPPDGPGISPSLIEEVHWEDLVKFAKLVPTAEECLRGIDQAESLIRHTRPLRAEPGAPHDPGHPLLAHPWALLGLLAAAAAAGLLDRRRRRLPRLVVPESAAARAVPPSAWARRWWLPGALVAAAIALTSIGLAGPRLRVSRRQDLSVEGIDIVVALDLSTSMLAADFQPNTASSSPRRCSRSFIASAPERPHRAGGLRGRGVHAVPAHARLQRARNLLDQVRTGVIEDGTAIGNALGTAVNRLRESERRAGSSSSHRRRQQRGQRLPACRPRRSRKELGIKVYTILIGKGGRVPYPTGTDLFGRTVYDAVDIDVNPELLQQIARGHRRRVLSGHRQESLRERPARVLDRLEKSEIYEAGGERPRTTSGSARFFLAGALLACSGWAARHAAAGAPVAMTRPAVHRSLGQHLRILTPLLLVARAAGPLAGALPRSAAFRRDGRSSALVPAASARGRPPRRGERRRASRAGAARAWGSSSARCRGRGRSAASAPRS